MPESFDLPKAEQDHRHLMRWLQTDIFLLSISNGLINKYRTLCSITISYNSGTGLYMEAKL